MILAVDVDYRNSKAVVAGVSFNSWSDEKPIHIYHSVVYKVEEYESGSFYRREMPCITQLLKEHHIEPDIIVIDGFVYLGDESRPGLGMHLYNKLDQAIPVIGVAKKPFRGTPHETELLRGRSSKPLYITAVGIDLNEAKDKVLSMYGNHRTPSLIKEADRVCRKLARCLIR